jgi:hypothetical protein
MPLKASYTEQAGRPGFDSQQCKILLLATASRPRLWGHPASYPIGTGALSHGIKRRGVPRSRIVELYLHSRTSLHGTMLS